MYPFIMVKSNRTAQHKIRKDFCLMNIIKKRIGSLISMLLISAVLISAITAQAYTPNLTAGADAQSANAVSKNTQAQYISSQKAEEQSGDTGSSQTSAQTAYQLQNSEIFNRETPGEIKPQTDSSAVQRFMEISSGNIISDSLANSAGENIYTFTAKNRGTITYSFSQSSPTSAKLRISLYQEFVSDGQNGEVKYRELYTLYSAADGSQVSSLPTGVYPGNYRIYVSCESSFTKSDYNLKMTFTRTNDYECEGNSTLTRYNELSLNRSIKGSCAQLANGLDSDCYMFEVTQNGFINFTFVHDDMKLDQTGFRIYIYDMYGNNYYFLRSSFTDIILSSGNIALTPGYYFLEIDSHIFCETEYILSVRFTQDDDFENESNDTMETANEIILGKEIYGNITPRSSQPDADWFTFELKTDGSVLIDFLHSDQGKNRDGWNIKLTDKDGKIIYSDVSKWSDQVVQSPFIGLSAGKYYICIDAEGLNLSAVTYAVLITSDTASAWEAEPNDTFENANTISIDSPINGTMLENGVEFDRDMYKFTLDQTQKLSLVFAHTALAEDREGWIITLYDADKNEITSFTSGWNQSKVSTETLELDSGEYYISVDTGTYYSNIRYILTLSKGSSTDIDIGVNPADKDKNQ